MPTRISAPTLSGTRSVSSLYQVMSTGLTHTVLLIGHADSIRMYEPFRVTSMQSAINYLQADFSSPLMAGLLEAYAAGCKDIWIYSAAPMSEYEENPALRLTPGAAFGGLTFYQKYYQRLADAYATLMVYDWYEIVVPIEAPFYDAGGVDFCTQLATFCSDSFSLNSSCCMGVMGTRVPNFDRPTEKITNYNDTTINAMINDTRIPRANDDLPLGAMGKFVMVVVGEGVFIPETAGFAYNRSLDVAVAGLLATTSLDRSLAGLLIPGVASTTSQPLTVAQIAALAEAKLNPVAKTAQGRRGGSFQVKILTDNTLGQDGTDYWSAVQMKLVCSVINKIRALGYAHIGGSFEEFRKYTYEFLSYLEQGGYIDQFNARIIRDPTNVHKAIVEVALKPIMGIRNVVFQVSVGPGI